MRYEVIPSVRDTMRNTMKDFMKDHGISRFQENKMVNFEKTRWNEIFPQYFEQENIEKLKLLIIINNNIKFWDQICLKLYD